MIGKLKILVVDDSALMRRALTDILEKIPGAEIRSARNGQDALDQLGSFDPNVVTLDVNMPVMDGLTCLSRIMTESPRAVVMVSSITSKDAAPSLEALSMGAVDVIEKPDGTVSTRLDSVGHTIRRAVRTAAKAKTPVIRARAKAPPTAKAPIKPSVLRTSTKSIGSSGRVVVLGISTGGPNALEEVIPVLPQDFPVPIVIAQHMPGNFTGGFAARLDAHSKIRVVEVTRTTPLEPSTAYVLHGGADGVIRQKLGRLVVESVPADAKYTWHPSVDRLAFSALEAIKPNNLLGVLMTGMGDDGAEAMTQMRNQGCHTIAESEKTAVVYGMPRELVERNGAGEVTELHRIASRIRSWAGGRG